jgi:hypothetical protein
LTPFPLFQSLLLISSCINTIWNFIKSMLETRRNFEHRLCSRNMMHKKDIMVWVWNLAMYKTFDVSLVNECMTRLAIKDMHKDMIIARN